MTGTKKICLWKLRLIRNSKQKLGCGSKLVRNNNYIYTAFWPYIPYLWWYDVSLFPGTRRYLSHGRFISCFLSEYSFCTGCFLSNFYLKWSVNWSDTFWACLLLASTFLTLGMSVFHKRWPYGFLHSLLK